MSGAAQKIVPTLSATVPFGHLELLLRVVDGAATWALYDPLPPEERASQRPLVCGFLGTSDALAGPQPDLHLTPDSLREAALHLEEFIGMAEGA